MLKIQKGRRHLSYRRDDGTMFVELVSELTHILMHQPHLPLQP